MFHTGHIAYSLHSKLFEELDKYDIEYIAFKDPDGGLTLKVLRMFTRGEMPEIKLSQIDWANKEATNELVALGPSSVDFLYKSTKDNDEWAKLWYYIGMYFLQVWNDSQSALPYLMGASNDGCYIASRALGILFGENMDIGQAETYLTKATKAGDTISAERLMDIYKLRIDIEKEDLGIGKNEPNVSSSVILEYEKKMNKLADLLYSDGGH